jgi:hypothetical protein
MPTDESPTAVARRLVAAGERDEAEKVVNALIAENFNLPVERVAINADWSSLNSLNGIVDIADGRRFFFKFHQEEGEGETVQEYYRAELLESAGYPVDVPAMMSRQPGHQILLYAFRRDRQLAAACLDVERDGTADGSALIALQRELDRLTSEIYLRKLHASSAEISAAEPIHQLFHHRLVTPPDRTKLGGRVERFYAGEPVVLPGCTLSWEEFVNLRWRINGVEYRHTLGELFHESLARLEPASLGSSGATVAHGDAHNANVWIEQQGGTARLVLFDPAFAGQHVPALLADVKATFHNIFAHPFWLYHPAEADERFHVALAIRNGWIEIEHGWAPSPLRTEFLALKSDLIWRPLLAELRRLRLLPEGWRRIVRCALFCCPTLVLNLSAGAAHGATAGRTPAMSALSFAISIMSGSEPGKGSDPFVALLDGSAP